MRTSGKLTITARSEGSPPAGVDDPRYHILQHITSDVAAKLCMHCDQALDQACYRYLCLQVLRECLQWEFSELVGE